VPPDGACCTISPPPGTDLHAFLHLTRQGTERARPRYLPPPSCRKVYAVPDDQHMAHA
jgi:hypothetical protein